MGRRRGLLRGTQGPYAGYKYWRFRPSTIDGTPYSQAYFRIYELNLYESYDQAGSSHPTTLLTGDSSNSSFLVTVSTAQSGRDGWEAFDGNTGTDWQPNNSTASWLEVELNRNRLFKSLTIKTYNNAWTATHILVEASDTGAWAGEEVEIGITDTFSETISTKSWNLYGDEYPTKPGAISTTSTAISSVSVSVVAATPPSGETIVAYHWYKYGVFHSETTGITNTFQALTPGAKYAISVKAEASGGNIGNLTDTTTITADTTGINYVADNGSGSYLHYRFQNYELDAATTDRGFLIRLELHDAVDLGGTRYPTAALTSNTSDANFTATRGFANSASYEAWKCFNLSVGGGWWTIGISSAADNWIQCEFDTAKTIESIYVDLYTTNHYANQLRVMGSATGAFAGEEDIIGTVSGLYENGVIMDNFEVNLDTSTYGANIITNGDFAGGLTDWTTVTGTPSVVSGKLILEANEATKQLHTMTGSHLFKITISNMTAGELDFDLDGTTVKTLLENGTHQFIHTPVGQGVELTANASFDGEIDNVEVFPIN